MERHWKKRFIITIISVGWILAFAETIYAGDINSNGKVGLEESVYVLQVLADMRADIGFTGDINGDGVTNLQDAIHGLQIVSESTNTIYDEVLSLEEAEFLDNSPEAVFNIEDIVFDDGENIYDFILKHNPDFLSQYYPGRRIKKTEKKLLVIDPLIQKKLLTGFSLLLANYLVIDKNHKYPAGKGEDGKDDPNQPAQTGLAYSFGSKDYKKRQKPPAGACEEKVYGLDCSGFVYQVLKGAGLDLGIVCADQERNVGFLNNILKDHDLYSNLYAKEMARQDGLPIPSEEFQQGDIIYWKRIRCERYKQGDTIPYGYKVGDIKEDERYKQGDTIPDGYEIGDIKKILPSARAVHIGIILKSGEKLMIFQSNGSSKINCHKNYGTGRGPRTIDCTSTYWFDEAVYGIVRFQMHLKVYVDKNATGNGNGLTPEDAFPSLADALNKVYDTFGKYSTLPVKIIVAPGTYYIPDISVIRSYAEIYGINRDTVIITGSKIHNVGGKINNCTFTDFLTDYDGGGIYNEDGTVSNCTFINCMADNGGGIYNRYGTVSDCTFIDCSAKFGGGIFNYYGKVVNNCTFSNCSAVNSGGGIYNHYNTDYGNEEYGTMSNSAFTNCSAGFGGGIFNNYGRVNNCTFSNCLAEHKGGGIYNYYGVVNDCSFAGCLAVLNGESFFCGDEWKICLTKGNEVYNYGSIDSCVYPACWDVSWKCCEVAH